MATMAWLLVAAERKVDAMALAVDVAKELGAAVRVAVQLLEVAPGDMAAAAPAVGAGAVVVVLATPGAVAPAGAAAMVGVQVAEVAVEQAVQVMGAEQVHVAAVAHVDAADMVLAAVEEDIPDVMETGAGVAVDVAAAAAAAVETVVVAAVMPAAEIGEDVQQVEIGEVVAPSITGVAAATGVDVVGVDVVGTTATGARAAKVMTGAKAEGRTAKARAKAATQTEINPGARLGPGSPTATSGSPGKSSPTTPRRSGASLFVMPFRSKPARISTSTSLYSRRERQDLATWWRSSFSG